MRVDTPVAKLAQRTAVIPAAWMGIRKFSRPGPGRSPHWASPGMSPRCSRIGYRGHRVDLRSRDEDRKGLGGNAILRDTDRNSAQRCRERERQRRALVGAEVLAEHSEHTATCNRSVGQTKGRQGSRVDRTAVVEDWLLGEQRAVREHKQDEAHSLLTIHGARPPSQATGTEVRSPVRRLTWSCQLV